MEGSNFIDYIEYPYNDGKPYLRTYAEDGSIAYMPAFGNIYPETSTAYVNQPVQYMPTTSSYYNESANQFYEVGSSQNMFCPNNLVLDQNKVSQLENSEGFRFGEYICKPRGRPPKSDNVQYIKICDGYFLEKKPKGRPRKYPKQEPPVKKSVGRPRKQPVEKVKKRKSTAAKKVFDEPADKELEDLTNIALQLIESKRAKQNH